MATGREKCMKAKQGDKVKVHYKGTLEDGEVFDSSEGSDPLEFTIGEKMVIPGFENAVVDLKAGESKKVDIPAAEAYGEHKDDMMVRIARENFPENVEAQVGVYVTMQHPEAGQFDACISGVSDAEVILDANHPLAGKDLSFEIELVEIVA